MAKKPPSVTLAALPKVGDGATISIGSDRYPATIIAVTLKAHGPVVTVQRDRMSRTDSNGQSEDQAYTFTPNPAAKLETYSLRRDGTWRVFAGNPRDGHRLTIGGRSAYLDPHF